MNMTKTKMKIEQNKKNWFIKRLKKAQINIINIDSTLAYDFSKLKYLEPKEWKKNFITMIEEVNKEKPDYIKLPIEHEIKLYEKAQPFICKYIEIHY